MLLFSKAISYGGFCLLLLNAALLTPICAEMSGGVQHRDYLEGDVLAEMDAPHSAAQEGGVQEHIDSLNRKHFGNKKNKLFKDKQGMEAHARKGMRNKFSDHKREKYRDHKQHQIRERNGDL